MGNAEAFFASFALINGPTTVRMTTLVSSSTFFASTDAPIHCSAAGSVELGELGAPPSRIKGNHSAVSSAVMALGGLGLQGEPVATSPIGRTLYGSIAVGVGLRDISAQVQGVGIALHDSASSRTAYAVFVVPQRLKCSFSWSWFRRDESQIHQDFRNRSQPYRLEMRLV